LSFLFKNSTTKRDTLFLDKDTTLNNKPNSKEIDIVLSPSLYWATNVEFNIKSKKEIKKILPSIFEGNIPQNSDTEYNYYLYSNEGKNLAFAYNGEYILSLLEELDISSKYIKRVYFAQIELNKLYYPLKIDNHWALVTNNDMLIKLPFENVDQNIARDLNLEDTKLSKNYIKLDSSTTHNINSLYILFITLISIFVIEAGINSYKISKLESQKEDIFSRNNLPATNIQTNAIHKKLLSIYHTQKDIRRVISTGLSIRLLSGEYLKSIDVKSKKIELVFNLKNLSRKAVIVNKFKKSGFIPNTIFNKNLLRVEVKL
jgi:hypothetical protein